MFFMMKGFFKTGLEILHINGIIITHSNCIKIFLKTHLKEIEFHTPNDYLDLSLYENLYIYLWDEWDKLSNTDSKVGSECKNQKESTWLITNFLTNYLRMLKYSHYYNFIIQII